MNNAFLLIAVIGSGIAAQRLSPNDTGLELLENAAATAAALIAIILAVGAVSGAHLNPVVTLADRVFGFSVNYPIALSAIALALAKDLFRKGRASTPRALAVNVASQ